MGYSQLRWGRIWQWSHGRPHAMAVWICLTASAPFTFVQSHSCVTFGCELFANIVMKSLSWIVCRCSVSELFVCETYFPEILCELPFIPSYMLWIVCLPNTLHPCLELLVRQSTLVWTFACQTFSYVFWTFGFTKHLHKTPTKFLVPCEHIRNYLGVYKHDTSLYEPCAL